MTPMDVAPEGWSDFFVATAGAAAALAGLIIVAMTVNVSVILAIPSMSSRAGATIGTLVLVVVSAAAGLIPQQSAPLLGVEILLFALVAAILEVNSSIRMVRLAQTAPTDAAASPAASTEPDATARGAAPPLSAQWIKATIAVVQVLPFVFGAVLLLAGDWSGLYAVAAGILLVFICSVSNAWVLLVEILR